MINRFHIVFLSTTSVLIATFPNAALAGISISCGKYKELWKNSSELFFNSDKINNSMYRYGTKVNEDTVSFRFRENVIYVIVHVGTGNAQTRYTIPTFSENNSVIEESFDDSGRVTKTVSPKPCIYRRW